MKIRVTFLRPSQKVATGDRITVNFPFTVVDDGLIGKPEEQARTHHHEIDVSVSGTLEHLWNLPSQDLLKVMFEYGRRHAIEKLKDGTLLPIEELLLLTNTAEIPCPYDPARVPYPDGVTQEVSMPSQSPLQASSEITLAAAIIDCRDNINALFHERHKDKLLLLTSERDLLQLFRTVNSEEEFAFRVCSLANVCRDVNPAILRKLTGNCDSQTGSLALLDQYASSEDLDLSLAVTTFRAINSLRKAFPVHHDTAGNVLKAFRQLEIDYPIQNHSEVWAHLLERYLNALKSLLVALKGKRPGDTTGA